MAFRENAESRQKYVDREQAHYETLKYYFDEEWFDFEELMIFKMHKTPPKKRNNLPYRCPGCRRPWRFTNGVLYFLDKDHYKIPLEEKTCDVCI